jgi:hypothetical protein
MDSLIAASARALAAGDPLGALERIALRDAPPALALRGIAMAHTKRWHVGWQKLHVLNKGGRGVASPIDSIAPIGTSALGY